MEKNCLYVNNYHGHVRKRELVCCCELVEKIEFPAQGTCSEDSVRRPAAAAVGQTYLFQERKYLAPELLNVSYVSS